MASRREKLMQAVTALLDGAGKPDGATVHRFRVRPIERDRLPSYIPYPTNPPPGGPSETVSRLDHDPGVERVLNLRVEIRASAMDAAGQEIAPDTALDPHYTWVVRAIMADPTLGGLAEDTQEVGSSFDAAEINGPVGACAVDFEVTYITDEHDPEEGPVYDS